MENTIQRAAVLATSEILLPKDLPLGQAPLSQGGEPPATPIVPAASLDLETAAQFLFETAAAQPGLELLPWLEKEFTRRAMESTGQNQVHASKLLGITRATLRKRLEKLRSETP